ncbi:MAG: multidrug efflux RND transporter permease subunit [Bryobacteraceae bacterium]
MSISEPFIHRPVATTLLTIALGMAGGIAYFFLPVAPLPQVEFPTLMVSATLPGASPETMASSVATPLERQFGRIAGLNEMTSNSSLGSCNITMQFDLSRNIDASSRDVQAAINAARGQLPNTLPQNPSWRKINPADSPILFLALTSPTMRPGDIYDVAASILQQKISQMKGVGQVIIGGGALPGVRVEVNPTLLNNSGLGLEDIRAMLGNANQNRPKGDFHDINRLWTINDTDQLRLAAQYKPLIITYKNGAPVKLSDVANVVDSVEDIRNIGFANHEQAMLLIIFRQPDANIIETVDRIRDSLPQLQAQIPAAMHMQVILDRTTSIRGSVKDVEFSMVISIVLVIMVVFLFLRSVRTTLIPSVAVPISLVATFGVLYLFGYSIDNLSLMALTIATGFVVDDAIVVIENITRYLEEGMAPMQAALKGAAEIGFTVLSISISLIAVFLPILMMGGIVGRLFREFAVTLSVAIIMSMVISLTTTPMMCARLLRSHHAEQKHGWVYNLSERGFDAILSFYQKTLSRVLRHQFITLVVTLSTLAFTVYLYIAIPKGFFPQQDTGRLSGSIQADQATSFQAMKERLIQLNDVVLQDPAVDTLNSYTGAGGFGGGGTNAGRMFVTLKPLEVRKINSDEVIARLRPNLAKIPGVSLYLQSTQDLRIGGRSSGAQYQYTLQSDSVKDLNEWAPLVFRKLKTLTEISDVNTDQQDKGLESTLVVDRRTAGRLGISAQNVDDTLYDAFGQRQVSTMYTELNQYHVVMEVDQQFWQNPEGLRYIYVEGPNGTQVPLSAVTKYVSDTTPLSINHQGQFPSVTLSFNIPVGLALGDAVPAIENAEREIGLPSNVKGSFQGTAQAYQESLANEPILIAAALVTVYIVLGVLYESLIHPITILSTLPSAGVGALLALRLTGNELNVISLIGIILLIGIVKKNAIMMIDFAIAAERKDNKSPEEAIYQACLLRFRPITMTTMAALLGGLPLALGTGVGSEMRRPLGIAIVGGLLFSQVLTLYTTPVVYLYLDRMRLRWEQWNHRVHGGAPAPSEAYREA